MQIVDNDNNYTVINHEGIDYLFSYKSLVATLAGKNLILYSKFDYSNTTSKHVKRFTGFTSGELKKSSLAKETFNITYKENK